jgi:DNA processing protein
VPSELAERVARLADRGVRLQLALDELAARGIWILTRLDEEYPSLLRDRFGARRPVVLAGAGSVLRLGEAGVAVVGSRDIDEAGAAFAAAVGRAVARQRVPVVSGAARGVDRVAMDACLDAGGTAVGVVADSLARTVLVRDVRCRVADGSLTLVTTSSPWAPFSAGAAMERNRYVYALSSAAVVVASADGHGGTWAGAVENLEHRWVPLWVRDADDAPTGNAALIGRGALPLRSPDGFHSVAAAERPGGLGLRPTLF